MGMENSCQRIKGNTQGIMGAMEIFQASTADDGICLNCDTYNSELDKEGYCLRDDFGGGLDCWRDRVIDALRNGKAKRLDTGELIWLKESYFAKVVKDNK